MKRRRPLWPAAIVFLLFAGLFLALTLPSYLRGKASLDWPTTGGHVVSAFVRAYHGRVRGWGGFTGYDLEVRYEYEVAGRRYESSTLSYERISVDEFRRSVHTGEELRVFYDPRKPAHAVLQTGADRLWTTPFFLLGLGLSAAGVVLLIVGIGRRN